MKDKNKKNKISFLSQLANRLESAEIGEVDQDGFDDGSSTWVTVRIGGTKLSIEFDGTGEYIEGIGLYEDIVEIVGEKKIWGS